MTHQTLPSIYALAAERHGAKTAITDGAVSLTWRAVDVLRRRVARALIATGIGKGDRVAIWAPNIHEWIVAAMGIQTLGAILVPLNTRFRGAEAADILRRSGARLLFTVAGFLDTDYPALLRGEELSDLRQIVLLRGESEGLVGLDAFLAAGDGVPAGDEDRLAAAVAPTDFADLMFTSGTTGRPKGALLTHGQNIRAYRSLSDIWGLNGDDTYLVIPPFFHSFGYKAGWMACALYGARVVPAITFDLDALLPLIKRERVSVITGLPTVFHSILAHLRRHEFDLSSLRLSMTGAASVPVELVRRMYSDLKLQAVTVAYGMTECTAIACVTRRDDDPVKVATTVGKPLPDVEIRCADAAGNTLPAGQAGEILVRGYQVMGGYFNDPAATASAIDPQGWLHTGDVGMFDEDGYLKITDRLKDMYICGGFDCYPAEIENILMQMPGVAQAAVIGIPDERMGEVGKAFIIQAPGAHLSESDVLSWARDRLANFKMPREVEFIAGFPLNASGKVLKTELRRL